MCARPDTQVGACDVTARRSAAHARRQALSAMQPASSSAGASRMHPYHTHTHTSCLTASLLSLAVSVFSRGSTSLSSCANTTLAPPAQGCGDVTQRHNHGLCVCACVGQQNRREEPTCRSTHTACRQTNKALRRMHGVCVLYVESSAKRTWAGCQLGEHEVCGCLDILVVLETAL